MVNHMRTRVIICPNPKCHNKIKEPILLTTPAEHYYACPRCFIKLNEYTYAQEEYTGTTVEEYLQDSVFGRAAANARARAKDASDILAPNYRFRHP